MVREAILAESQFPSRAWELGEVAHKVMFPRMWKATPHDTEVETPVNQGALKKNGPSWRNRGQGG